MNKIIFHYMLATTLFRQPDGWEGVRRGSSSASPLPGANPSVSAMLGWGLILLLAAVLLYLFIG